MAEEAPRPTLKFLRRNNSQLLGSADIFMFAGGCVGGVVKREDESSLTKGTTTRKWMIASQVALKAEANYQTQSTSVAREKKK